MKCSFCKKDQTEVKALVCASEKTSICDECVLMALEQLIHKDIMVIPTPKEK